MATGSYRVSVIAIAAVAMLALGLVYMSWFKADVTSIDATASTKPTGTAEIELEQVKICHDTGGTCATASPSDVIDNQYAIFSHVIFGLGILFGLLILRADNRRIADGSVGLAVWVIALVFGAALLVAIGLCLIFEKPDALVFEIVERVHFREHSTEWGYSADPTFAAGGFMTLAGALTGVVTVWRARVLHLPDAVAPVKPRRLEPVSAPPKIDADPFRSAPEPPPLALVHHDRPVSVPRAESDHDDPGPKLLR